MDPISLWYILRSGMQSGGLHRETASEYLRELGYANGFASLETAVREAMSAEFGQEYRGIPRGSRAAHRGPGGRARADIQSTQGQAFEERFNAYLAERGVPADARPGPVVGTRGGFGYRNPREDRYSGFMRELNPSRPLHAAMQGMTFEWGDEIMDAIGLGGTTLREEASESRAQHPVKSALADFGAGLGTGLGAIRAAAKLKSLEAAPDALRWLVKGPAQDMKPLARGASRIAQHGALGSIGGAAHGAGAGFGPQQEGRVAGALLGGTIAGVTGAITPALGRGAKYSYNALVKGGRGTAQRLAVKMQSLTGIDPEEDIILGAMKKTHELQGIYIDLEKAWPEINDTKLLSILDDMAQDTEVARYVPPGTSAIPPLEPSRKNVYLAHAERLQKWLDADEFDDEAKDLRELINNYEEGARPDQIDLDLGITSRELPSGHKVDDTPGGSGEALINYMTKNPDLDVQRRVRGISAGMRSYPGVPRERMPSFLDVQRTVFNLRRVAHSKTPPESALYFKADLEEAMNNVDPRFRFVQEQWRIKEVVIQAAERGELDWRSDTQQIIRGLEQHRYDPEAKDAYVSAMLGDIMRNLYRTDSRQSGKALRTLFNDATGARKVITGLFEEAFAGRGGPGAGERIANQLYRAVDNEKALDAVFRRMHATFLSSMGGTDPRRTFAMATMFGRVPIGRN